jgi:hypothetical protein
MPICPKINQPENDVVMTPPILAGMLVDYLKPTGKLLDPCRGEGAFYDHLSRYSDDVAFCEISEGRDYMAYTDPVDWVITNPPWSKMVPFMEKSFELSNNVALLATVTNFVTRSRLALISKWGFGLTEFIMCPTPRAWTQTGFQVAMAVFRKGYPNVTTWTYLPDIKRGDF